MVKSGSLTDSLTDSLTALVTLPLLWVSDATQKTKMMLFHYKQRNVTAVTPKLKINGILIEKVKTFNFLGMTIDEHNHDSETAYPESSM